jgi:hypothetical protein
MTDRDPLAAVRTLTESTWALAAALSELLLAGDESYRHEFWKGHIRRMPTITVAKRLVRAWHAFQQHPDRDVLGPDVWCFVNSDLDDAEFEALLDLARAQSHDHGHSA